MRGYTVASQSCICPIIGHNVIKSLSKLFLTAVVLPMRGRPPSNAVRNRICIMFIVSATT